MKVVINVSYGAFCIPQAVVDKLGLESIWECIDRTNPVLVAYVEQHPGEGHDLVIVEVPDDVKWHIKDYDGVEHVAEDHRTWYP